MAVLLFSGNVTAQHKYLKSDYTGNPGKFLDSSWTMIFGWINEHTQEKM